MDTDKIRKLKVKIKSLTREINECIEELSTLVEGEVSDTGATDNDMGIQDQLNSLLS